MKCIGSDKDGYDGMPEGVCRYCIHMADDHNADGSCTSCDEIMATVLDRWNRGEGSPPPGFVPTVAAADEGGQR